MIFLSYPNLIIKPPRKALQRLSLRAADVVDVGNNAVHGLPSENTYMHLFADTLQIGCHEMS